MEALEMERPMTEWNDDRLDELNGRVKDGFIAVDKRFEQVDERFIRLEKEMKEGFEQVDERFVRLEAEMKEGFAKVDKRFDKVDQRFGEMGQRFATREEMGEVRAELRHLNERFDRLYYLIVVTVVALAGTLLANSVWG